MNKYATLALIIWAIDRDLLSLPINKVMRWFLDEARGKLTDFSRSIIEDAYYSQKDYGKLNKQIIKCVVL